MQLSWPCVTSAYDTAPRGVGGLFLSSMALISQKPCAVLQTQVFFLTNHLHFMRSRPSLISGQHCESENIYMTAWVLWRRTGKLILWGGVTVKQHCSKWMAELIPMLTALFHYTNKESYVTYYSEIMMMLPNCIEHLHMVGAGFSHIFYRDSLQEINLDCNVCMHRSETKVCWNSTYPMKSNVLWIFSTLANLCFFKKRWSWDPPNLFH